MKESAATPYGHQPPKLRAGRARRNLGRVLAWSGLLMGPAVIVCKLVTCGLPRTSQNALYPLIVGVFLCGMAAVPGAVVGMVIIPRRIALDWGLFVLGIVLLSLALLLSLSMAC
ncbi:MAG: hypothetical protein KDB82_18735 [Planctomycetes bacterium]|nr:hypothetical protein [Planctomycetota bacterium]